MANAAVVIPVYKENLNEFEKISLTQVKKILGKKYPIIFVAPEGKKFPYFSKREKVVYFKEEFFKSIHTYNILMKTKEFYQAFLEYEYILIYQLDAFVFSDKLEYFCNLGYDNIGAPWPYYWCSNTKKLRGYSKMPRVGNGGFCLRKVQSAYKFIINNPEFLNKYAYAGEDDFWAYVGVLENSNFKAAPFKIANSFAVEYFPERCVRKNGGELPFGCHGWYRFNADSYLKILSKVDYDFQPFKNQMHSDYLQEFQIFRFNDGFYQAYIRRINKTFAQ